jgi:hypothetical protein
MDLIVEGFEWANEGAHSCRFGSAGLLTPDTHELCALVVSTLLQDSTVRREKSRSGFGSTL